MVDVGLNYLNGHVDRWVWTELGRTILNCCVETT